MPVALSLRELIFQDVVTTLETITTGNGYASDLGVVTRGGLSPLETEATSTWASLLPVSDEPTYGAGVNRWQLTFLVRTWIDVATTTEAAAALEALIADIQQALQVDQRRGGYAEATLDGLLQYRYLDATMTVAGADIGFLVHYKTTQASPRIAA